MTNPTLVTTPFAENGDKNIIPESVGAEPQNATMQAGFPPITQQKISEGGIPPERNDFNGILNLYGQHIVHLNKGLPYEFDQAFADVIGGYPLNARVMLDSGDIVRSTVANNTVNPNSDMTGWINTSKHNGLADRDAPDAHPATAIIYNDISVQEALDDQKLKNEDLISVKDNGAKGDGTTDDSPKINAFVSEGEQLDKRYSYYYFPNFNESYLLNSPVKFKTGGIKIFGFKGASYNTGKGRKGNILVAGTHGFDLGDNRVVDPTYYTQTDGWTIDGLSFLQAPSVTTAKSVDAIRVTPATNGPDRGFNFTNVSVIKMNRAIYVPNNAGVMIGTAVIERCNLSQNNYSFLSHGKIEGFRFVGNQAENNSIGGIDGYFNGACDISNNMLEGQPNAVKIRGYQVYATVSKNYFEANSGDFAVDFSATVDGSSLILTDNVAYTLTAKDYCLIRGNEFNVPYHVVNGDRYAVTLLDNVSLAPTSKLINQTVGNFKVKIDTGDIGAKILNRTLSDAKQDPSYTSMGVRGNSVARYLDSPQGKVLAPIKNDYFAANVSTVVGDVLAFNMLIKCVGDGTDSALYFQVFNSAITNIVTGDNFIRAITGRINNEYVLATYFVRVNAATASVLTRIYHATFDVQMIACCVKNLGQLEVGSSLTASQVMPILNKDLMALVSNTSSAISVPANTQTIQTFAVAGASLGDIVDVGVSVYNQYLNISAYVSSANNVTILFKNDTASAINIAQNSTFKIKVTK